MDFVSSVVLVFRLILLNQLDMLKLAADDVLQDSDAAPAEHGASFQCASVPVPVGQTGPDT
jgi:hypothetical protein